MKDSTKKKPASIASLQVCQSKLHKLCLPLVMYLKEKTSFYQKHFALKVSLCGVELYSIMAKGHWGIADIKNDIDAMEVL